MALGQLAESSRLIRKFEAERVSLGLEWAFETSEPTPVTHLLQDRTSQSFPPVPPVRDQAFKYVSLLGPFSFKQT